MKYEVSEIKQNGERLYIVGWVAPDEPSDEFTVTVSEKNGEDIHSKVTKVERPDVSQAVYHEHYNYPFGYWLEFDYSPKGTYTIRFDTEKDHQAIVLNRNKIKMLRFINKGKYFVALALKGKLDGQLRNKGISYADFRRLSLIKRSLRKTKLSEKYRFSIIIPVYETPETYLRELLDSIENQTYENYEVCLADGSRKGNDVEKIVREYQRRNGRIRYRRLTENRGISGNTNAALEMAKGDFIVLCDHDDTLEADALYRLAEAAEREPECDCIYSDEDKIDETGKKYFDAHFKPDYNIDLLCSVNYICHIFAVRRSLVEKYGGFRSEYDGAQDYDFILRMSEKARKTVHVPMVLYHWRTHMGSTSENPESKLYAYEAGARAIREHYRRVWPEIEIEKIEKGISLGIYHTYFKVKEEKISVIIPNKDHTEDLDKAIRSMIERGTWKDLEFIVVENNSEEEKTFEYYKKIQEEYPQVKVVYYEGGFNYSKINNYGEKYAAGKYLLFMNNDVELIEEDSMREMVGYLQREDVGAVGCRLLYEDDTIQHAGVVIGIGVADHLFKHTISGDGTYFNRAVTVQDYSAVTAAVMMVKKADFEALNGFDESFEVAFNDIDLCLRIRESGKLVVYNPYACFHHYESKSRGKDLSSEEMNRNLQELERFTRRWKKYFQEGDPYYNPNLTLKDTSCGLRE